MRGSNILPQNIEKLSVQTTISSSSLADMVSLKACGNCGEKEGSSTILPLM